MFKLTFNTADLRQPLIDLLLKKLELHPHEASVTVDHLIRSEQYGKSSHGLIRVPYLLNSGKFGPFKNWAGLACEKGIAVFLVAGSPPRVAPLGSKSPVVGTNAICVGVPS